MASVNKVIIVGNLGRDPETRYMQNGTAVTNASVATTYRWKDKESGEQKEETEWHRLTFLGRLAEVAGEYLKKGSPCYVEGCLRTRKWQDKDGVERYTTEIIVDNLQLLGSKGDAAHGSEKPQQRAAAPAKKPGGGGIVDMDDDIPFVSCALGDDYILRKAYRRGE